MKTTLNLDKSEAQFLYDVLGNTYLDDPHVDSIYAKFVPIARKVGLEKNYNTPRIKGCDK
jgi:hypothetical protein